MRLASVLALGVSLWIVGCCFGRVMPTTGASEVAQQAAMLKPGDVLLIVVFGEKDFSGEYPVLDDGSINGRFGRIVVSGKSIEEAEKLLLDRLKKDLLEPNVSIAMKKQRQELVFLVGVQTQGPVDFVPGLDLRQVVASVNLPADADQLDAQLFREGKLTLSVNLRKLLSGADLGSDIRLRPNDVVSIQPSAFVRVWVTGSVTKPGQTRVPMGSDVYQAVAAAGGLQLGQNLDVIDDQVRIVVRRGGTAQTFPAKQDPAAGPFTLENGDTIIIQLPAKLKVTVGGEVIKPGEYALPAGATLPAVVAAAGGLGTEGSLSNILVVRSGEAMVIDASQVANGNKPDAFQLKDGDLVYLRKGERLVYAFGTVQKPGRYLIEDGRNYRVTDVLARAGGLTDRGTLRRVVLARQGKDGKYELRQFNLDEFLKGGKIESNPLMQSGDILLFGQPRSFNIGDFTQVISSILLLDNLLRR